MAKNTSKQKSCNEMRHKKLDLKTEIIQADASLGSLAIYSICNGAKNDTKI